MLGWLAVGLEMSGVKSMLAVRVGSVAGMPIFVLPVVAIAALCAPPGAALWTALALGLLCDLTSAVPTTTSEVMYHIGPGSVGLVLGAQFVLRRGARPRTVRARSATWTTTTSASW